MNTKKGFTLLEVLIATVIMVSALGALVYGLSQCSNLAGTVHNQDIASNAAQQRLEAISNSDFADPSNSLFDDFDVAGLNPPSGQKSGQVIRTTIVEGQLYDLKIIVTWLQKGPTVVSSRTLSTTLATR